MKKGILLISVGTFNLLHGLIHLIQFIQSMLLITYSINSNSKIDNLLHNPILSILFAVVGFITIYIGIKDFKHHKKCE